MGRFDIWTPFTYGQGTEIKSPICQHRQASGWCDGGRGRP
jgi:hypothetical protein